MSEQQEAETVTREEQQQTKAQQPEQLRELSLNSASSSSSSLSLNSISLIKLDELSSFGATKQSRLPALIKLNSSRPDSPKQPSSMPSFAGEQLEQSQSQQQQVQCSLPNQVRLDAAKISARPAQDGGEPMLGVSEQQQQQDAPTDKENEAELADSFQVVDMVSADLMGPSLPQAPQSGQEKQRATLLATSQQTNQTTTSSTTSTNGHPSHLGDSLIEMIVNLKNENQNLVRALETNNEYVKERLSEFKRVNEESKRREAQFAVEKADHEHQVRKLQRQNMVLSERLKSMEAKLKDMKLEIGESLQAANSSKASSVRDENNLYPTLGDPESFSNLTSQQQAVTMQVGENDHDHEKGRSRQPTTFDSHSPTAPPMETDSFRPARQPPTAVGPPIAGTSNATAESLRTEPMRVGAMSKEELSKRFDADKAQFYAMDDDPMKECDKLEQQLNDIGKRDYEICLLQQQLNIYRQDFRLERMANLEAKLQIERLKTDIDRLCLERLNERRAEEEGRGARHQHAFHRGHHRSSAAGAAVEGVMGKLGHHLSKKAAKSAAKAAKYASKQAHREEKAMAAAAAAAASAASGATQGASQPGGASSSQPSGGHRRHHSHLHGLRTVRSEVVNDLMSTANKAMLTGYKMASTHVNLALDKLSQFEQSQASHLAQSKQQADGKAANTQPMRPPSVD